MPVCAECNTEKLRNDTLFIPVLDRGISVIKMTVCFLS